MPRGEKVPNFTDSTGACWRLKGEEVQIRKNGNWVKHEGAPAINEEVAANLLELRNGGPAAPPVTTTDASSPTTDTGRLPDAGEAGHKSNEPRSEPEQCGETYEIPGETAVCVLPKGHEGQHETADGLGHWDQSPAAPTDPVVTGDPIVDSALAFKAEVPIVAPTPAAEPPKPSPGESAIALLTKQPSQTPTVTFLVDIANYFQVRPYGKDEVIVVRPVNGRMPRKDAVLFAAHLLSAAHGDLVEFEQVFHAVRHGVR